MKSWWKSYMELNKKHNSFIVLLVGFTTLVITVLLSLSLGAVRLPLKEILSVFSGNREQTAYLIVMHVRIPRTLATVVAGGGLAVSGLIIQNVLGNPLAGPNIIGVNAGAGFMVVLCCAVFPAAFFLVPIAAFIGALAAMLLIYALAMKTRASKITLVLAGVAVSSFLTAGINTVTTLVPDVLPAANAFRIGGVSGAELRTAVPTGIIVLICSLLAFCFGCEMDVLSLGEESAQSLGLRTRRYRFFFLIIASALAGAAVSIAGLIGFVGLLVPHAARFFTINKSRVLIPVCLITGAAFTTLCDILARTLFAPFEIPVGLVLSFLGAPFFIWLLLKQRRRRSHD